MSNSFQWKDAQQLSTIQLILAFAIPSAIGFVGFRAVLPWLIRHGQPKLLMWGSVAAVMLGILVIAAVYALKKESTTLGISFVERACLRNVPRKMWLVCLAILIGGLALSAAAAEVVAPFSSFTGLHIPSYMPFWLDPSVDPMNTPAADLSPGYPLPGNYPFVLLVAVTLLLNISAEELYFRAWLMPKMQRFGKWQWAVNGLLFALYHTFQLWLFPMLCVVSLAAAFTVYLSKSIWPAFTIHIIANFLFAIVGILALVFG